MTEKILLIDHVIGRTITDIRCKYGKENGWLDTAECFIELDQEFYIEIPYGKTKDVIVGEPDQNAKSIFDNLSDIPEYHFNKEGKSIAEVIDEKKKRKQTIFNRLMKIIFNYETPNKEYNPYKIEYHENKLKYIVNRKIVDYLWDNDSTEKGFFELDNGYFISEQYMAPSGTGLAGLNYYDSLSNLQARKGNNLQRYSEESARRNLQ
ncbi:MAG: hypothetical protein ACKOX3_03915 [Bacteroidota bacterium]